MIMIFLVTLGVDLLTVREAVGAVILFHNPIMVPRILILVSFFTLGKVMSHQNSIIKRGGIQADSDSVLLEIYGNRINFPRHPKIPVNAE